MTTPMRPARHRAALASVVIALAFALTVGALVAASRPAAPGDSIAAYLPERPTTRFHADVATGQAWQVNQGVLPAAAAWDELDLLARRHLDPVTSGHWLTVDLLDPARPAARLSIDFQVDGDTVSLRALATPDASLTLDPGIPVLDPGLLDGVAATWEGTLTRDGSPTAPGTALVTSEPLEDRPGCVDIQVQLEHATEVATWCAGENAGLTGWRTESSAGPTGFTPEVTIAEHPGDAVEIDENPVAALTGEPVREVEFFRIVAGSYREQLIPRGSRVTWAADQLVIADTEGRVTSWLPIDDGSGESYYSQVWRTQPGGSIRGLVAVGAVTVLGTTDREVIAYDRDGWELWRHTVADGVTQVSESHGQVVVGDASGAVTVLDPLTGDERWSARGTAEIVSVGGDPGTVVVLAGSSLRVHDLKTGTVWWTVDVDPRTTVASATGAHVAIGAGNWLTVREARTGSVQWARAVPSDLVLAEAGQHLLVSEPRTARLLDQAGRPVWASEHPMPLVLPMDGAVLAIQGDGLVLAGLDTASLTWEYPDDAAEPDLEPIRGDHGIVTVQLLGGHYRWWEYR
ncbi:PQQ-binding-like beta-propeller repeat protein [Pseudactinotalea sp.]|uniref:outer membrane protein assembly factor BamB family protein n=1 Tax=Pseudactinotalea sp. TaxID=1926260 RepID=UPI003B3A9A48